MINHRIDGRYDDLWGPAVLCSLLVAALIVSLFSRLNHNHQKINDIFLIGKLLLALRLNLYLPTI